ncbi:MAG: hypothetical protein IKL00_11085, partial [Oscillospiraceae bacterium]|nr:hypothetical protein [Oscillospiraceae bacterium]
MRPTKRERMSEQKHGFDARTPKRYAQIDWFDNESSWAQTAYQLPEEYEEFLIGFQSKIQDAINCIDIDGKKNGDVLDSLIDSETHIALRKIRLMR